MTSARTSQTRSGPDRDSIPAADTDPELTAELRTFCRNRWPEASFDLQDTTLSWIDGPGYIDVRAVLTEADFPFEALDNAGIRLRRRLSRQVLAVTVLTAIGLFEQGQHTILCQSVTERRDAHIERWCMHELDQLARHPIPPGGPPPLHPEAMRLLPIDELWARAEQLVDALGVHRPVQADHQTSQRVVVRRMAALAAATGPDRLPHPTVRLRSGPSPNPEDVRTTGMLLFDVAVPVWPDTSFVAVIPTEGRAHGVARSPQLWWTDGPSPAQLDVTFKGGLPDPLAGCRTYTAHRQLSDTALAAAMLLYRRLHAEPYCEPSGGFPTAAWMRSPAARQHVQRNSECRARLAKIRHVLLALPFPLNGPLPEPLDPDGTCDGASLWAAAQNLLALTYKRRPEHNPVHARPEHTPRRRLAVELGSTLERLGHDAMDRLAPDPAGASSHTRPS